MWAEPPARMPCGSRSVGTACTCWIAQTRLVVEAQRRSSIAARPLVSCRVGDARALDLPSGTADVVLLLGPLYHLTDARDRVKALGEAARILKPGGLLFAAAISRWASALDGLARELLTDTSFTGIVERDLRSGQHRNPTERVDYFTTAYFHRPDELASEVGSAGLELTGVFGIEGPGWILPDVVERMTDPTRREMLLRVAQMLEAEPAVIGTSAHLLAVARR
jgi:SAM-dependent methyltransferase